MFCVSFCLLSASRSLLPLIKSIGFTWRLPDRKWSCNSNRESGSNVSTWTHRKKQCSLMFFQFLSHPQTRGRISGLLCTIPRAAGSLAAALGFPVRFSAPLSPTAPPFWGNTSNRHHVLHYPHVPHHTVGAVKRDSGPSVAWHESGIHQALGSPPFATDNHRPGWPLHVWKPQGKTGWNGDFLFISGRSGTVEIVLNRSHKVHIKAKGRS